MGLPPLRSTSGKYRGGLGRPIRRHMKMVNTCIEREVVGTLGDAKCEAIPFERPRCLR